MIEIHISNTYRPSYACRMPHVATRLRIGYKCIHLEKHRILTFILSTSLYFNEGNYSNLLCMNILHYNFNIDTLKKYIIYEAACIVYIFKSFVEYNFTVYISV